MKNTTEIYNIVDTAAGVLRAHADRLTGRDAAEAYVRGWMQSTLAHVLIELNEINPKAAERFVLRLENLTKEL